MADQQGTGKHPHKKQSEPHPHTRNDGEDRERGSERQGGARASNENRQQRSEQRDQAQNRDGADSGDLKSREYRGPDGEIHHHTRAYQQQQGGEKS